MRVVVDNPDLVSLSAFSKVTIRRGAWVIGADHLLRQRRAAAPEHVLLRDPAQERQLHRAEQRQARLRVLRRLEES
jgi:hypothetical protein